jgi:hypothetical protein
MGRVTSRYAARDQDRDGNFDRGAVKSNQISQELLQDLPRGESRIQLLPDKGHGRIGVTMFHTAGRGVTIQMDWRSGDQQTTPMRYSHEISFPALKFGNRASQYGS